jgi:Lrp/AsnC family leucine-responsive transcriptional regulator
MIDGTDRTLLGLLSEDARQPYAELGQRVHLSAPAVHARVKKLEQTGAIRGYTIRVDPERLGKSVCAFIRILLTGGHCDRATASLQAFPEIEECHSVAGEDCILVKARTATPSELQELLEKIARLPGFGRTVTTIVLRTHFERTPGQALGEKLR